MSNLQKAYSPNLISQKGHLLIDLIAHQLSKSGADNNASINYSTPEQQYQFWKDYLMDQSANQELPFFQEVINRSVNIHSPGYMGHQIAVPLPITMLSSFVINYLNNGMGVYEMGMTGNSMEKIIIEIIANKIGYDSNSSGFIVTGGSIGNLTAILAARAVISNIWEEGNKNIKYAIMVSEQAHYCVERAARILGLGKDSIIKIPVNNLFKADCGSLEGLYQKAVEEGVRIICCVGCACTTATGSYDDLNAIGDFCKKYNIWFHVDGAHGGAAIFSEKHKHLLEGIEKANSVIIDFHKMMMTPSLSTALIFKQGSNSYQTFSQKADYLWKDQEDHEWYNSGMRTMECTKSMSILNIFSIFKFYGEKIFEQNIDYLFDMAKIFYKLLKEDQNFEIPIFPESNIFCFRYQINGIDLNNLNNHIRNAIIEDGEFYLVQTKLNGSVYLRVSLMNPFTTRSELEKLISKISLIAKNYKP